MIYPRPIPILFQTIAEATAVKVLPVIQAAELKILQESDPTITESNITSINYQYGQLWEIIETLKQYEQSPTLRYQKYPLIALILDIRETYGNSGGYPGQCTLEVVICHNSEPAIKSEERYSKVIKPILLPVYEELIKQIECCRDFVTQGPNIQHTKVEHPYHGVNKLSDTSGNVFADFVDAIEIKDLQLTINFKNC